MRKYPSLTRRCIGEVADFHPWDHGYHDRPVPQQSTPPKERENGADCWGVVILDIIFLLSVILIAIIINNSFPALP